MLGIALAAVAVAAVLLCYAVYCVKLPDTEWRFYIVPPFRTVRLKDGSVARFNDLLMRRRLADGTWEYRWPTEKEAYKEWIDRQW